MKRGYIPLTCNSYAGIAWQGEYLPEFWMWNGCFTSSEDGSRYIETVRVSELKEAALRLWRDGWVPLRPVDGALLRRMEQALRAHRGLREQGAEFPDGPFLDAPAPVPEEHLSPEAREYLGLGPAGAE